MIVRKTNPSALVAAPEGRASSTGALPEIHNTLTRRRLIVAETYHEFSNDLPDQPGLIALVGVNGTVEPFLFLSFHSSGDSRACQQ